MEIHIHSSRIAKFLFSDTRMALVWLVVRVWVGWQWLMGGWEKLTDAAWTAAQAGAGLGGFLHGALAKTAGAHPDVQMWYAWFVSHLVLPYAHAWSYVIAYGELLVGLGLIVGLLTGLAAFFGFFMNLNFLLAGTVSLNPIMLVLSVLLMLAWRVAGWIGLDRFLMRRRHHVS